MNPVLDEPDRGPSQPREPVPTWWTQPTNPPPPTPPPNSPTQTTPPPPADTTGHNGRPILTIALAGLAALLATLLTISLIRLSSTSADLDDQRDNNTNLNNQLTELDNRLSSTSAEASDLEDRLSATSAELDEQRNTNANLNNQLSEITGLFPLGAAPDTVLPEGTIELDATPRRGACTGPSVCALAHQPFTLVIDVDEDGGTYTAEVVDARISGYTSGVEPLELTDTGWVMTAPGDGWTCNDEPIDDSVQVALRVEQIDLDPDNGLTYTISGTYEESAPAGTCIAIRVLWDVAS